MDKNRTRIMYAEALLEISKKKALDKITIKDLLDHSHSARQTFYNYFRDKDDLIQWVYSYSADRLLQEFGKGSSPYECYLNIVRSIFQFKDFYSKALQLTGQNNLSMAVYNHSCDFFANYLTEKIGPEILTDTVRFHIAFNCHGAVEMVKEWIINNLPYTPEEITRLILDSMPSDLKALLSQ